MNGPDAMGDYEDCQISLLLDCMLAHRWLATELLASFCTLAGMYLGSTTAYGAVCYVASMPMWFGLMFHKKLWGLVPLNVVTLALAARVLWGAA